MDKWIKRICNLLIMMGILGLMGSPTRSMAANITELEGATGYIGKEDIKWGTGQSTDTFTVTTYDGGSATLTKLPDPDAADESVIKGVWYVAAMAGDHGNAALTGSLAWVIATLAGDPATVILPGNQTYQVSTDLTVPATVCLVMHRGAVFSVDAVKTLTINGDVLAGAYQIFSGAGTITLGANILEHDSWRDGAGDDILPSVTNTIDLGSTTQKFKDGHFAGDLYVVSVNFNGTPITATAAQINTPPVKFDGTLGTVLRQSILTIDDATAANEIKCKLDNQVNGDDIVETDDIGKGETVGHFTLDASGYYLKIEAAGLTGNCIAVLCTTVSYNASGTAVNVYYDKAANDISVVLRNTTSGTYLDLTTLVDTGKMTFSITYLTDA